MLYTARPLEKVYADPSVFNHKQKEQPTNKVGEEETEYREVLLPNGRIITRRVGENYVIERIHSTDMKDYLNKEYFPGKNIKK